MPCEQALGDRERRTETGSCMRARPKGRRTRESQINKHGQKSFIQEIDLNLTPDDIPCSSVGNVDNISKWTKPQLKFWLKCRRLNQPGRVEK